ncbi:MAG: CbiQ family ECF transporter T component [Gallionella sp.]|nr:CbiQ family ECF transporter T component [Gallionella sp.]MDD4958070.1 CbiQ family ECF transporter T component [Gallionella sp.]
MLTFHPAAQILTWCLLVATMQHLALPSLLLVTLLVVLAALSLSTRKLLQLIRRTRWLMLSLLLIYGYSTPGHAIFTALAQFSPTQEGVHDGVLQLARLLVALAGLAILLDKLHRQHWMAGLYTLFLPLDWLGLSRERFAVRLALTLHYAELAMLRGTQRWQDILSSLSEQNNEVDTQVLTLPIYRYTFADGLLLTLASLLLWLSIR